MRSILILTLSIAPGVYAQPCTAVTTLPAVLTTSGVYCLTANLNYTGVNTAIWVSASDVVLDLQRFTLSSTTGFHAILVQGGDNVLIRNGTIKGFQYGVYVTNYRAVTVEEMRIKDTTNAAILSQGHSTTIRRNLLTGPYGVTTSGKQARIVDNDIVFDEGSSPVVEGITVSGAGTIVQGNRLNNTIGITVRADAVIRDNILNGLPNRTLINVFNNATAISVVVENNVLKTAGTGILASTNATVKYRGNITQGVATPYTATGGTLTDAGNNQ